MLWNWNFHNIFISGKFSIETNRQKQTAEVRELMINTRKYKSAKNMGTRVLISCPSRNKRICGSLILITSNPHSNTKRREKSINTTHAHYRPIQRKTVPASLFILNKQIKQNFFLPKEKERVFGVGKEQKCKHRYRVLCKRRSIR